jgi:hypothetical protein
MGSLSGTKIKDTFGLLLKMATSTVSASEQVVQDGEGNNTALKLSTDTVESTGDFKCTGTMTTSTTDVQALMLSSTGVFVKRNLSTNPIGTTSVTANSPLGATGSTIGVLPASSLVQLTSQQTATIDKFLIWDESSSSYKYIDAVNLADYVINSGATAIPAMFIAKPQATTALSTASTFIAFAEIANQPATGATDPATSCVALGGVLSAVSLVDFGGGSRNNIRISTQGMYRLESTTEIIVAAGTPNTTIQIYLNDGAGSAVLIEETETNATVGKHAVTIVYYFYADSGVPYDVGVRVSSTTAATLGLQTSFSVTKLGDVV